MANRPNLNTTNRQAPICRAPQQTLPSKGAEITVPLDAFFKAPTTREDLLALKQKLNLKLFGNQAKPFITPSFTLNFFDFDDTLQIPKFCNDDKTPNKEIGRLYPVLINKQGELYRDDPLWGCYSANKNYQAWLDYPSNQFDPFDSRYFRSIGPAHAALKKAADNKEGVYLVSSRPEVPAPYHNQTSSFLEAFALRDPFYAKALEPILRNVYGSLVPECPGKKLKLPDGVNKALIIASVILERATKGGKYALNSEQAKANLSKLTINIHEDTNRNYLATLFVLIHLFPELTINVYDYQMKDCVNVESVKVLTYDQKHLIGENNEPLGYYDEKASFLMQTNGQPWQLKDPTSRKLEDALGIKADCPRPISPADPKWNRQSAGW